MSTSTTTILPSMKIEAYAKVNLTLEVFGVRGDGYHALRSVVAPISLSDTIEIDPAEDISSDVPFSDDLCLKAAKVLRGKSPVGAKIHVVKRIPAGGGLGGGSADAAAVLRALNEMWGIGLSQEELADVGAQVGSDVPALVLAQHYRAPVIMEGRGEKVRLMWTSDGRRPTAGRGLNLVLVNPGVHTSTPKVFALADERDGASLSATDECIKALLSGKLEKIAASFVNDLTIPACQLHPEIVDIISSLRGAGAAGVTMSGSGSTVFGLMADEATAKAVAEAMKSKGFSSWNVRTLGSDMV